MGHFKNKIKLEKVFLPKYYAGMQKRSSKDNIDKVDMSSVNSIDTEILIEEALRNGKNPAAVLLGRLGGLKGGKARAVNLSSEQRREIAQKAAKARWEKK